MNNLDRWNAAKFTRSTQINAQADKIARNRARYAAVSAKTGVPWDVIGVIHYRESAGDFAGVLHNGQKIIGTGKKTTIVPKGRGPFSTWEAAAIDALMNCAPYAGKHKDWSIAGTLDILERYNGLGYRKRGLPSPYLWAGTDQYTKGKYVADGKYDPNHVDKQLGVAPILMKLRSKISTEEANRHGMKKGDRGEYVRELQANLITLGHDIVADGSFGAKTEDAVKVFQRMHKLESDGIAGPRTVEAIGAALKVKESKPKIDAAKQVIVKEGIGVNEIGGGLISVAPAVAAAKEVVEDVSDGVTSVMSLGPWVLLAVVGVGFGFYVIRNERQKKAAARSALEAME